MKAYGLSNLLRYSIGVNARVIEEDGTELLKIISHLEPDRLKQLQVLVEVNDWELCYRAYASGMFLAIKEKEVKPWIEDSSTRSSPSLSS